jgi:hypothetical protein
MDVATLPTQANSKELDYEYLLSNISFNEAKLEEVSSLLKKATRGIILPVKRIEAFFKDGLKLCKSKFEEIKKSLEKRQKRKEDSKEESQSNQTNNNSNSNSLMSIDEEEDIDIKLKISAAQENSQLEQVLEKVISEVSLFNNLFNSKEFSDLIEKFHSVNENENTDSNIINNILGDDETNSVYYSDSEDENEKNSSKKAKTTINKKKNRKILLGKKKKRNGEVKNREQNSESQDNEDEGHINTNGKSSTKKKKRSKSIKNSGKKQKTEDNSNQISENENNDDEETKKQRLSDEECTDKMKEKFGNNFKGITKTFLTRKLTKKVIWSSEFDFKSSDPFSELRDIIKSATYKYAKINFSISHYPTNALELVKSLFKKYILTYKEKQLTVAGEMDGELENLVEKFRDEELVKKFHIDFMKIEVYAFMEEILAEFDDKDENTLKNYSDEEIETLRNDWETIQQMRVYWKELKTNKY